MEIVVRYSDFGAVGDGVNNDFAAIKAAHDYANERRLSVEGEPGKTYRLGDNGGESVIIKTDTLWAGCAFILDDSEIMPDDKCRTVPLFKIVPDRERVNIEGVTSIKRDAKNIGIAPGEPMLIHVINEKRRRYIRYGLNQDAGDAQREIILVDKDGNVDPSTPVSWDYDEITKIYGIPTSEEPVTVCGGDFTRYANHAPNQYTYYHRGIDITRSNVTLRGLKSKMIKEGETRAPYTGFIVAHDANNVAIENCIFHAHNHFYRQDPGGKNLLGSYEINFTTVNNLYIKNCFQPNMYDPDGKTIRFKGEMGSNYCRNLTFDGCHLSSFDSHKGSGNITIINSEIEHINCIGSGHVHIENTVIHMDAMPQVMTLRGDYGCIWRGDAYFKNVTLVSANPNQEFTLMGGYGEWNNYDFGYETCMPHTVTVNNLRTTSGAPVYLYRRYIEKFGDVSMHTLDNGEKNLNPYKPTETVIIESNKYGTEFIVNDTPLFANTKIIYK